MGVFYKLKNHKKGAGMDLTISKSKHCRRPRRTLTMEGEIVEIQEEDVMRFEERTDLNEEHLKVAQPLQDEDKQFTAEHILQLCRFLAERSKINRKFSRQKQSSQCQLEPNSSPINDDKCHFQASPTLPLLHTYKKLELTPTKTTISEDLTNDLDISHILSDKSTAAIANFANVPTKSLSNTNSLLDNNPQRKREVLLKIRNQIFERRRQRQMLKPHVEPRMDVWRPW